MRTLKGRRVVTFLDRKRAQLFNSGDYQISKS